MSPALAGGFFTTEPPWKPSWSLFIPPPHDPSSILNPQALASSVPSLDPHRSLPRPPLTRFYTRDLLPAPPCQHLTRCLSRGFIAESCPLHAASPLDLFLPTLPHAHFPSLASHPSQLCTCWALGWPLTLVFPWSWLVKPALGAQLSASCAAVSGAEARATQGLVSPSQYHDRPQGPSGTPRPLPGVPESPRSSLLQAASPRCLLSPSTPAFLCRTNLYPEQGPVHPWIAHAPGG